MSAFFSIFFLSVGIFMLILSTLMNFAPETFAYWIACLNIKGSHFTYHVSERLRNHRNGQQVIISEERLKKMEDYLCKRGEVNQIISHFTNLEKRIPVEHEMNVFRRISTRTYPVMSFERYFQLIPAQEINSEMIDCYFKGSVFFAAPITLYTILKEKLTKERLEEICSASLELSKVKSNMIQNDLFHKPRR